MEVDAIVKCLSFAAMAAIAYMLYYHHQAMKKFEEQLENEGEEVFSSSIPQPSKRQKTEKFHNETENFGAQSHDLLFGASIQEEYSSYQPLITIPTRHEVCVGTEDDIEIIENGKPEKRPRNSERSANLKKVQRKPIPFVQNGVKEKNVHCDVNFHKDRREAFYAKLRERPNSPVKRFVVEETKKKANEIVHIIDQKPQAAFSLELSGEKVAKMREEFKRSYKEAQAAPKIAEPVKKVEERNVNLVGNIREAPKPDSGLIKSKEEAKIAPLSQEFSQKSSPLNLSKQFPEITQKSQTLSQDTQKYPFGGETLQKTSQLIEKSVTSEASQKSSLFGGETAKVSTSAPAYSFFASQSQAALFSAPSTQKSESDLSKETEQKSKSSLEPSKVSDTGLKFLFSSSAIASIQMPKPPAELIKKQEENKSSASSNSTQPILAETVKSEESKKSENTPALAKSEESNKSENKPAFPSPFGSFTNPFTKNENQPASSLFGGSTIFSGKTESLADTQKSAGSLFGAKIGEAKNFPTTATQSQPPLFPTNLLASSSTQPSSFSDPFKLASEAKTSLFPAASQNKDADGKQETQIKYPELPKPPTTTPQNLFPGLPTNSLFNAKSSDKSLFQSVSSQGSFFGTPNLTPFPDSAKSQTPPTSADQKPQTPPTSSLFGSKFPFSNPSAFNPNSSMNSK
ncbi:unnamed protein product [Blepharisma stoltei]|uniref:Uncharacterized protein n=1 Tax=Blepharisma stoltei TaxID=1481888 RepID=A0AAU9J409_9CILI|nr:unnamed protein product [Blepharisma stoltei]